MLKAREECWSWLWLLVKRCGALALLSSEPHPRVESEIDTRRRIRSTMRLQYGGKGKAQDEDQRKECSYKGLERWKIEKGNVHTITVRIARDRGQRKRGTYRHRATLFAQYLLGARILLPKCYYRCVIYYCRHIRSFARLVSDGGTEQFTTSRFSIFRAPSPFPAPNPI